MDADRALVEAVLANRPGAFERLVRESQGLCWHVIQRMVRHPEDTRELCQEAFLRVHRYLHQYRYDSPLKSWIGQVAYSVARRHLERKRVPLAEHTFESGADDEDGLSLLDNIGDGTDLQAEHARPGEERALPAPLEKPPPPPPTILTLYYLEELPIGEIASITGIAEGSIKSHLFRSRQKLRERLESRIGVAA